jgi:hypothetical protein
LKVNCEKATIIILLSFLLITFFFLPYHHEEWIISPAEEFHGWQLIGIDGSLSFWILGFGLNHKYVFFRSTNGTIFPCEDMSWSFTKGDIRFPTNL